VFSQVLSQRVGAFPKLLHAQQLSKAGKALAVRVATQGEEVFAHLVLGPHFQWHIRHNSQQR